MELLLRNVRSEALPDRPVKDIYLCSSATIGMLAGGITPTSPNFGLLLAMDGQSIDSGKIGELAEKMADKGLAYLCAWGPDCERVHDIFDEIEVQRDLEKEDGSVIMTTWHSDESLEECLWFFVNSAFPDLAYEQSCKDWIIAPLGNEEWEKLIRDTFKVSGDGQVS